MNIRSSGEHFFSSAARCLQRGNVDHVDMDALPSLCTSKTTRLQRKIGNVCWSSKDFHFLWRILRLEKSREKRLNGSWIIKSVWFHNYFGSGCTHFDKTDSRTGEDESAIERIVSVRNVSLRCSVRSLRRKEASKWDQRSWWGGGGTKVDLTVDGLLVPVRPFECCTNNTEIKSARRPICVKSLTRWLRRARSFFKHNFGGKNFVVRNTGGGLISPPSGTQWMIKAFRWDVLLWLLLIVKFPLLDVLWGC